MLLVRDSSYGEAVIDQYVELILVDNQTLNFGESAVRVPRHGKYPKNLKHDENTENISNNIAELKLLFLSRS